MALSLSKQTDPLYFDLHVEISQNGGHKEGASQGLNQAPSQGEVERSYHLYAVQLPDRDAWRARLTDAGVQTGVHYPIPVHLQPAYRDLGHARGDFPVSEAIASEVLSLPMFPELTAQQIDAVAGVIRAGLPAAARS